MNPAEILSEFDSTRDQIRQNTLFRVPTEGRSDGLSMAVNYSDVVQYVVSSLFDLTAKSLSPKMPFNGIGAFLYGSPGRREMVCESDLDMLLIYKTSSSKYFQFKERFKKFAEPFKFCKIDLPQWGTLEEAEIFAEKSITEGNQVLECRFVCGDEKIRQDIEKIQTKYGGPERMVKNIAFQKFYFDQYYKQRVREGAINVKYCEGGSRDYLFINWINTLMERKYSEWKQTKNDRPVAEIGLSNLYKNGLLSSLEFARSIEALNFNILLRNEILLINKETVDEGLTFLNRPTLREVFKRMPDLMKEYIIKSPEELKKRFDQQRYCISGIKKRIWDLMIEEEGKTRGEKDWAKNFKIAYSSETSEADRIRLLDKKDALITIALIWGASNSGQKKILENIMEREKKSNSWEIQASLATSPLCNPEYLDYIGRGIGKEKGYGYILRIVSRNPNVKQETLESIAYDKNVELRYAQCAKAALENGRNAANHQI